MDSVRMSSTSDDQEIKRSKSFRLEIKEDRGFRFKLQKSLSTSLNQIVTPPTYPKTMKQSKKRKETSTPGNKREGRGFNHVTLVGHFSVSAPEIAIHGISSGVHTTRQGGKF